MVTATVASRCATQDVGGTVGGAALGLCPELHLGGYDIVGPAVFPASDLSL